MAEMNALLATMDEAYKQEGGSAEGEFIRARGSLYEMLEKGYPLPEPLGRKEAEILDATLINTLIRQQNEEESVKLALYTLGLRRSSRAIPYILPLGNSPTFAVESIRALGAIGSMEALDLLLTRLEEGTLGGTTVETRTELIRALGSIGAKEAIPPRFSGSSGP